MSVPPMSTFPGGPVPVSAPGMYVSSIGQSAMAPPPQINQSHAPLQMASNQNNDLLPSDPFVNIRNIISNDLRQALNVLFKVAGDCVRTNSKILNENEDKRDKIDEAQRIFKAALDRFYEVCDNIEAQFLLILECAHESQKFVVPLAPQFNELGPMPTNQQRAVNYNEFIQWANYNITLTMQIQKAFENFIDNINKDKQKIEEEKIIEQKQEEDEEEEDYKFKMEIQ